MLTKLCVGVGGGGGAGVMRYLWGTDLIWAHFLKCAVCEINCVVKFYANKAPDEI